MMAHPFGRAIRRASIALAVCAGAMLLTASVIISLMVARRTMGLTSTWELTLAIELMVAAIFLGSPYTLASGGYVSMDLLSGLLGERARRCWQLLLRVVGAAICLYMAWEGLRLTLDAFRSAERALGLWQPLVWPRYATVPVGMLLTALQYMAEAAELACARHERSSR